jgi:hypothetical protein
MGTYISWDNWVRGICACIYTRFGEFLGRFACEPVEHPHACTDPFFYWWADTDTDTEPNDTSGNY